MHNKNIAWSWYDGEDVYTNTATSLREIVEEVAEYYSDGDVNVSAIEHGQQIILELLGEETAGATTHIVQNEIGAVVCFLNELADYEGRPDLFSMCEI